MLEQDIERVLVSQEQLQARVAELAARISRDYRGRHLLVVGVLKGAFMLVADLVRNLDVPVQVDFIAASSYGSASRSSGVVRVLKDLDRDIRGQHVLLVEDVLDTGLTLDYLLRSLRARQPASLEACVLLAKPAAPRVGVSVRYKGFDVPDGFVVGYGIDYAERYRNLPYVAALKPEVYGGRR